MHEHTTVPEPSQSHLFPAPLGLQIEAPSVPAYDLSCPLAGTRPSGCRSVHGISLHSFQTHHLTAPTPPTSTQPTPIPLAPPTHSAHITTSMSISSFAVTPPPPPSPHASPRVRARPSHSTPPRLTQYGGVTDTYVTATRGSNGSRAEVTVGARSPTVTWSRAHSQEPVGPLHHACRCA